MDSDIRALERLAKTGDPAALAKLRAARARAGTVVAAVHYVPDDYHDCLSLDGKFKAPKSVYQISAPCGVRLYPRGAPTQRKACKVTKELIDVSCKTCIRTLSAPKVKLTLRRHYSPGSRNGRSTGPVCGKSDPNKYKEEFLCTMAKVNCPVCCRIMQKGCRRARLPRQMSTLMEDLRCLGLLDS